MEITVDDLIADVTSLVSLPEVYLRIGELLDEPDTRAADLGEVICYDPALATRLLSIVNSAYYEFPSQIDDLARAIEIISAQDLRDIALAAVTRETFSPIASELVDMSSFWHHSMYCGLIARSLARASHREYTDFMFAAGLLHDVGHLVMYNKIPELANDVLTAAEPTDDGLYQAEKKLLGFTHCDVGAALFKAWNLPVRLQAAVQFHHAPAEAQDCRLEIALLHLANSAANSEEPGRIIEQPGGNITECTPIRDPVAWQLTGLSEDMLDAAATEATEQLMDVARIISPDLPLL